MITSFTLFEHSDNSAGDQIIMAVDTYFPGKIRNINLSRKNGLMALFEAIANSMDAIADANADGDIKIIIHRNTSQIALLPDENSLHQCPITGFDIIDNGVGFNEVNFNSFNTSHSPYKFDRGGKGEGRWLWLKVFDQAEIDSIFFEDDKFQRRILEFVKLENPIPEDKHIVEVEPEATIAKTVVKLRDAYAEYSKNFPKTISSLANEIIDHFLPKFVLSDVPRIVLEEASDKSEVVSLNHIYEESVSSDFSVDIEFDGQLLKMHHFLLKARAGSSHQISYCAVGRTVERVRLTSNLVPNLPSRIRPDSNDESLVYSAYVTGDVLNKHADLLREKITLPNQGEMKYAGQVYWDELKAGVLDKAIEYLADITEPIKAKKQEQIAEFIATDSPQFRPIFKFHPEVINSIAPNLPPEKLGVELYRAMLDVEGHLLATADEILSTSIENLANPDPEVNAKYDRFLEEWNEVGKTSLARYVAHRAKTLELLRHYMKIKSDGKYVREDKIHDLIFPRKHTSNTQKDFFAQNLWIIDEKLVFHRYLASDIPFSQMENGVVPVNDNDRPDILAISNEGTGIDEHNTGDATIFDNRAATTDGDPIHGLWIVEFKRPMRPDGDPIEQVTRYVRKIRRGYALDNDGQSITVDNKTPIYCYIVTDLQQPIREKLDGRGFVEYPDRQGFFWFNQNLNVYYDVMSFKRLTDGAEKRNKILFDILYDKARV